MLVENAALGTVVLTAVEQRRVGRVRERKDILNLDDTGRLTDKVVLCVLPVMM